MTRVRDELAEARDELAEARDKLAEARHELGARARNEAITASRLIVTDDRDVIAAAKALDATDCAELHARPPGLSLRSTPRNTELFVPLGDNSDLLRSRKLAGFVADLADEHGFSVVHVTAPVVSYASENGGLHAFIAGLRRLSGDGFTVLVDTSSLHATQAQA